MVIPEVTEQERVESFINERLGDFNEEVKFSKKELAEFCIKEIDFAVKMINSTDASDFEDGDDESSSYSKKSN